MKRRIAICIFFNMNINQMKRAIHIRCTQQFLYFESHTKSLKQVCTHYGLFQYTFYQFCILISTYLINEEEISRNERYRVHVQTGITFARRKGITIARKIYLRVFFLFTFARIACYLEYIQFIHNIFCILQHDWRCNLDIHHFRQPLKWKQKI